MRNETSRNVFRLLFGPMPEGWDADATIAAGPWCFSGLEQSFPGWETRVEIAPDPLSDRRLEDQAIREAFALAADVILPLSRKIWPDHSSLPDAYWETLLAPFAINLAKQVVERWYRVKDLVTRYGNRPMQVELLPANSTFDFGDDAAFVLHGALNPVWNHWLCSELLRPILPSCWNVSEAPAVHEIWSASAPQGAKAKAKGALRNLILRMPFPPLKGMRLSQAIRYSCALMHESTCEDNGVSLVQHFGSQATGAKIDLPVSSESLFEDCLPQSIRELRHPEAIPAMRRPSVRAASILLYEDVSYRQRLALWRAAGGRLLCAQHGGNYGQMERISAMEFVEYSQHAFATWGWNRQESALGDKGPHPKFLPLPYPQLSNSRDSWNRTCDDMILVGTEMPTSCYQLDSHPMPLEVIRYRADKRRFLNALDGEVLAHTLYRPYFDVPGTLADADVILRDYPSLRRCTGPLGPQIMGCRLLVLDHHGTTLLEAMAADIPTICFWNPVHWPVSSAFADLLGEMEGPGMWCRTPEEAAKAVRRIWADPAQWWRSKPVQALRRRFMESWARIADPSETDRLWVEALKAL